MAIEREEQNLEVDDKQIIDQPQKSTKPSSLKVFSAYL